MSDDNNGDGCLTNVDATSQTDAAKALVAAVVRAFYDVESLVVVNFLLDAKFLRDGNNMGGALHWKTKDLREKLAFLQREHLVDLECVEGRVETRDKNRTYRRTERANFWYLDLNRAVHTIALRLRLIQRKLQDDINKAVSTSTYQCPGYLTKLCNGIFTEMEVQHCPVDDKHQFLCRECHEVHKNNPNPPPHSYVLQLVDNTKARSDAEEKLRRFHRQMRSKKQGDQTIRPGIFDLLQKVEKLSEKLGLPVTSNLPSDNGAQDVLIGNVLYDTTNFNQEAAEEFSNTIFVRGLDGQRMVLDLELGTGMQANFWAREGGSPPDYIGGLSDTLPKPQNHRTASLEAIAPIPRPKRVCRNTTPYFLKEYKGGAESAGKPVEDLAGPFRQMSIEMNQLDQAAADADAPDRIGFESLQSLSSIPTTDTCILWQTIQDQPDRASVQQFVQKIVKTQKSHRRTSSFPPPNLSPSCTFSSMDASSLFNSVDWQSTDSDKSGIEPRNETRASVADRWGHFSSVDMVDHLLPTMVRTTTMASRETSFGSMSFGSLPPTGKPARNHSLASLRSSIRNSTSASMRNSTMSSIGTIDAFIPRLPSMDAFAMHMGTFSTVDLNNNMNLPKSIQDDVNNNYNNNNLNLTSLNRLTSTDKANLDSLQLFRTKDFWENTFATKDMLDLELEWQHPPAQAAETPGDDKCIKPEYLASKDWISHDWVANMNSADVNVFQSNFDRKPAAALEPKNRWEKMYQDGLNPAGATVSQESYASSNIANPSACVGLLSDAASLLYSSPEMAQVHASSLFPPTPDKMAPSSTDSHQHFPPASPGRSAKPSSAKKKGGPEVKTFVEYTDLDVLCQRGTKSRLHPGSQRYRALVEHLKPEYHAIPTKEKHLKTKFAADLVKQVQEYGGRFLEMDKETGRWYIIADAQARRKAGQALRDDNTPAARKAKREKYSKKDNDEDDDEEE